MLIKEKDKKRTKKMNKIYNNLNIDNLMKTDWIKQFKPYQQKEIKDGYKKKLDISWYAKKEFDWMQMRKIRLGLIDNLDVSIYANPETPWKEMEQIRLKLLKEKYAL